MAAFNGKWKLTFSENVGAFSKSIGVSDEWIEKNKAMGEPESNVLTDELITTATDSTLVLQCDGKEISRQCVPLGKEVEHKGLDGRPSKMKVTVDGNTLKREQIGDDYTATYTRTIEGDTMTQVMVSSAGVTATRKLVKV